MPGLLSLYKALRHHKNSLYQLGQAGAVLLLLCLSQCHLNTPPYVGITFKNYTKLAEWYNLAATDAPSFSAIRYADFLQKNPQWPLQGRIQYRLQRALTTEKDPVTLQKLCPRFSISRIDLLQTCSPYLHNSALQARRIWRDIITTEDDETLFLANFSSTLQTEDHWQRYQRLENNGPYEAAVRQAKRLPPTQQTLLLEARLANRFATDDADKTFSQTAQLNDPTLLFYRLKYLRLHDRLDDALHLWLSSNPAKLYTTTIWRQHPQWAHELPSLVRELLRSNTPYAAQDGISLLEKIPPHERTNDALFLAGYISLLYLNAPSQAIEYFAPLALEKDIATHASGLYWMARASEISQPSKAASLYEQTASFPTTFYGQLALSHQTQSPFLTESTRNHTFTVALLRKLKLIPHQKEAPPAREDLLQAARTLVHAHAPKEATQFLIYLQNHSQGDAAQTSISKFALALKLPRPAILAARQLSHEGITFYPLGYPKLNYAQPTSTLPPGLLTALVRQESSMDDFAISPRYALGLTQILLSTAEHTIRLHHLPYKHISAELLQDPEINLTIGSAYLQGLFTRFDEKIPYTLAAYNAGPTHSQQWQDQWQAAQSATDSSTKLKLNDEDKMLHWIITLPYQETHTYIENIESDLSIYAALEND